MLQNRNFENEWNEDIGHNVDVYLPDGTKEIRAIDNIFPPPDWTYWFFHDPGTFDQPEARDAWKVNDPVRVQSGDKAYMWFTFQRRHHAGLYQQIQVGVDVECAFGIYCHAWSNHVIAGHDDCNHNPRCSVGVGTDHYFSLYADNPPTNTGDPWTDGIGNFSQRVGIDPAGGTDPFSPTVVWSETYTVYNAHQRIYTPAVVSQADIVTVFVESKTRWAFENNDMYVDEAELIIQGQPDPQYQFDSMIHLIPQDATLEERRQVEALAFPDKQTVTFSADEAGANSPAKSLRRVDVWGAGRWGGRDALTDYWIERHSPLPDEVNWREFGGGNGGDGWDRFLLWQLDPLWRDHGYGAPGCDETVGESGCYLDCLAMAQRIEGINPDATPVTVDSDLGMSGYAIPNAPCRPLWTKIEKRLRIKVQSGTTAQVDAHLGSGGIAMAEVEPEDLEHFVLVVEKLAGGDYLALDPLWNEVSPVSRRYQGVQSWRILTPVEPDTEPQYPPVEKLLCIHMQDPVPYWLDFVRNVQPEGHKQVATNLEAAKDVNAVSSDTLFWFRRWHNNQAEFYQDPNVGNAINRWLDPFWPPDWRMPAPHVRAVCGLNEEIGTGLPEKTAQVVRFETALAYEVQRRSGGLVVPVLLNPGVGNPDLDEHHLLLPAVQAAIDTGGFIGHHSYWGVDRGESHLMRDWEWHAGRCFEHWDPFFRSQGLYPRYLLTEVGAVWDDAGSLRAHNGWRSPECYGGNWDRYLSDLMTFRARVTTWNIRHGNRCLAASIFTSGGGGKWDSFEIKEPELRSLEAALAN